MAAQERSVPATPRSSLEHKSIPSDSFLRSVSDTVVKRGQTLIWKRKSLSFVTKDKSDFDGEENKRRWSSVFKSRKDDRETSFLNFYKWRKSSRKGPDSPTNSEESSSSGGTASGSQTYHHPLEGKPALRMSNTDDFITVEYPPPRSGTISEATMRACLHTPSGPGAALALHHGVRSVDDDDQETEKRPSLQFEGRRWRCDDNGWWVEPATPKPRVTKVPGAYEGSGLQTPVSYFDPEHGVHHEESSTTSASTLMDADPPPDDRASSKIVEHLPPSPLKSHAPFESDRFAIVTPTARVVHRYVIPSRRPPTPPKSPPPPPGNHPTLYVPKKRINASCSSSTASSQDATSSTSTATPTATAVTTSTGLPSAPTALTRKPYPNSRSSFAATLTGQSPPVLPPLFRFPSPMQTLRWAGYLYVAVCVWYALNELRGTIAFAAFPLRVAWRLVKALTRE